VGLAKTRYDIWYAERRTLVPRNVERQIMSRDSQICDVYDGATGQSGVSPENLNPNLTITLKRLTPLFELYMIVLPELIAFLTTALHCTNSEDRGVK